MVVDLNLLERWLWGWSLARGLPPPTHFSGGLVVDVGWPGQLRRHVFLDAGRELQACADLLHEPFVYLKVAVDSDQLRRALPAEWQIESPRYLMSRATAMGSAEWPAGYASTSSVEHGGHLVRVLDAGGQTAASGRVVLHGGTAVFDRIETLEAYRGRGLATALMFALDELATRAGVSERLLVATEAGCALYRKLGWQVQAPYSTAVRAAA